MIFKKSKITLLVRIFAVLSSAAIFAFAVQAKITQKSEYLWINAEQKTQIKRLFDLKYVPIRFPYTQADGSRDWLLKEYGKEQLIDYKVRVKNATITSIQVTSYRESYGGEIKQPRFLNQFSGASLKTANKKHQLSNRIDGITGATISVNSTVRIAKLALYLDQRLNKKK